MTTADRGDVALDRLLRSRKPGAVHPFTGARKMKPTLRHRPAIWENMLGTVYAMSPAGEVRYFDYDWDAARAFAGVDADGADPRVFRAPSGSGAHIRRGQMVLYVRRTP